MSAVSYQNPTSIHPITLSLGGISKVSENSVSQKEMVKIFNQKSGEMIQGMCRLEKDFESLFPLFKGIAGLGKPSSLVLTFSNEDKSIFYTFESKRIREIEQFFTRVLTLLQKEVRFKQVLKEVIANRQRFKAEQSLLQSSLFAV